MSVFTVHNLLLKSVLKLKTLYNKLVATDRLHLFFEFERLSTAGERHRSAL